MSVCSLDKLASIDIPAGKNSGIFGRLPESVTETAPVLWVTVRVLVWSSQGIQSIANFNIATWNWAWGFFFRSELPHHLRFLAPRSKPWSAIDRTSKNTGFFTRYFELLPVQVFGTEPSNFCIRGVELLIRLAFTLVVRHDTCTANFRHLGCSSAASNATAEGWSTKRGESDLAKTFPIVAFLTKNGSCFPLLVKN